MPRNKHPEKQWGESERSYQERVKKYNLDTRHWSEKRLCSHGNDKATCPRCNKSWLD